MFSAVNKVVILKKNLLCSVIGLWSAFNGKIVHFSVFFGGLDATVFCFPSASPDR